MIKNYTSMVSASKSVQHIEDRLIAAGAKTVVKMAEKGKLVGVAFVIFVNNRDMSFRLPARIDRVEERLKKEIKKLHEGTLDRIAAQAERTAWRLLSDWIDVQMSLIELDQAEFIEVFMPYLYDHLKDQTFFERMKSQNFSMLEDRRDRKGAENDTTFFDVAS